MAQAKLDPEKQALFEKVSVPSAIVRLAIPTIISQLITLVYSLADSYFIGKTGNPLMVAAVALVFPLFSMTTVFGNLFGIGGGSLVARMMGKGELDKSRSVCAFSFYAAMLCAALFALGCLGWSGPILRTLGASDQTFDLARQYMFFVIVLGGIPTVLSLVMSHIVRNAGYAKEAGLGMSIGAVLNIIFDPLFMFVLMPEGMEVVGAAAATMLSNAISVGYFIWTVLRLRKSSVLCLALKNVFLPVKDVLSVLSVGLPSGLTLFFFEIAYIVQNSVVASYGDCQLAALGIELKAERLPICIGLGICQATMPLVSYNFAAKNFDRMKKAVSFSRYFGIAAALGCVAFYQFFARDVISLFLNVSNKANAAAAETLLLGIAFLRVRCCNGPFTYVNFHITYMLQAMGFGKLTLFISLMRLGVIYTAMILVMNWLFGLQGVLMSQLAAELVTMTFSLFLFHKKIPSAELPEAEA